MKGKTDLKTQQLPVISDCCLKTTWLPYGPRFRSHSNHDVSVTKTNRKCPSLTPPKLLPFAFRPPASLLNVQCTLSLKLANKCRPPLMYLRKESSSETHFYSPKWWPFTCLKLRCQRVFSAWFFHWPKCFENLPKASKWLVGQNSIKTFNK